jgi:hypothetical protein
MSEAEDVTVARTSCFMAAKWSKIPTYMYTLLLTIYSIVTNSTYRISQQSTRRDWCSWSRPPCRWAAPAHCPPSSQAALQTVWALYTWGDSVAVTNNYSSKQLTTIVLHVTTYVR